MWENVRTRTSLGVHAVKLRIGDAWVTESAREGIPLVAVRTSLPHVALTFDDGPTPERTPRILDALAEHGATATFFVLGTNATRYPQLLRRVADGGHEIGLHGMDHRPIRSVSPEQLRAGLTQAATIVQDVTGATVRWYRPPYGRSTPTARRVVEDLGLTSALWSRTSWDWKDIGQDARVRAATVRPVPGAIVLLHDGHAGPEDGAPHVPEAAVDRTDLVRRIIVEFHRHGLHSRTVTTLLRGGQPRYRPMLDTALRTVREGRGSSETTARAQPV